MASNLKAVLYSSNDSLASNSKAQLVFTFSAIPVGFTLEDIKVTNGAVTNLVQSLTSPNIYTADFIGGTTDNSGMSTIKLNGTYTNTVGATGTSSNTFTIKNIGTDVMTITEVPTVGFTYNNVSVVEGNSGNTAMNFTVQLSTSSSESVTVNYSTQVKTFGSATANTDFVPVVSSVTFAPGETSKVVTVKVIGDTAYEGKEYFYLDITSASNANVVIDGSEGYRNSWSMCYITNDDVVSVVTTTPTGIYGTTSKDTIGGTAAGDKIYSMGGADLITGYAGADTFVFSKATASKLLADAATISDFKDGTDVIGLQGLVFSDLVVSQGSGNTIVSLATSDVLVVLVGVNASAIGFADFVQQ